MKQCFRKPYLFTPGSPLPMEGYKRSLGPETSCIIQWTSSDNTGYLYWTHALDYYTYPGLFTLWITHNGVHFWTSDSVPLQHMWSWSRQPEHPVCQLRQMGSQVRHSVDFLQHLVSSGSIFYFSIYFSFVSELRSRY